jgi:16S rRNA G966 N2-methylase RsmD
MSEKIVLSANQEIGSLVSGNGEGWDFNLGQEVIHRYLLPQVNQGDRVLDLGSGWGRASIPFIFKGAQVVMVDKNKRALDDAKGILNRAGFSSQLEKAVNLDVKDLNQENIGGKFKFIVACNAVTHMKKLEAVDFISRLPLFLENGVSYVYVDVPSKLTKSYETIQENSQRIDLDTFQILCGCSGVVKKEPFSFFIPGEAESILINHGGKIISNRPLAVTENSANIEIIARFN